MKHTFAKIMGLALIVALTLTGCNLIEVDEVMQANEEIAKIQKDQSVAVATYNDGEVTAAESMEMFNESYSNMAYMYYYYLGMNLPAEEIKNIAQETIEAKVEEKIVAAHFDAAGNTLTDEQLAEVQTGADEEYEAIHAQALSEATGKKAEYKEANAQVLLTKVGQTKDQIYAEKMLAQKANAMKQQLMDEVTEVTDDELKAAYDARVASNKETYDATPAAYGTDKTAGSAVIAYVPAGYRTVRHILVKPEDDVMNAYTDAKNALKTAESTLSTLEAELTEVQAAEDKEGLRTEEEINAEIETAKGEVATCTANVETARKACVENVSAKTTAIYEKLAEEGTTFEAVMAEFGEDPGMQDEANAKVGYYVCAESTNWQPEFTEGAMALANVGDYSAEPVVSGSGVHIIEYYTDVTAGEVPMADIHDALYAETLESLKTAHRDETVAEWIASANVTYNADQLIAIVTAA